MSGLFRNRYLFLGFGLRRLFVFALLASVLLCGIVARMIHAQTIHPWSDGGVEVDVDGDGDPDIGAVLTLEKGKTVSYRVRLSKQPENLPDEHGNAVPVEEWWLTLTVSNCPGYGNGECLDSEGNVVIRWVPSLGRRFFGGNDWQNWKGITIYVLRDVPATRRFTFAHHVWDDDANCPAQPGGAVTLGSGGGSTGTGTGTGTGTTTGGTATGGTSTGGTSTGGTSTGGTDTGGTTTGGADTGGTTTGGVGTGGTTTGGVGTGGADTGGTGTGGTTTGGAGTGGADTGGADTGGADTGGTGTGGAGTGGADTGGADTGGADTGGADTGGADTGGADTGGTGTGGAGTGGADTGGADTGGADTGGTGTGGTTTGGADTGGADTGGTTTGGADTGGTSTGGTTTGGADTGGTGTGGADTGGADTSGTGTGGTTTGGADTGGTGTGGADTGGTGTGGADTGGTDTGGTDTGGTTTGGADTGGTDTGTGTGTGTGIGDGDGDVSDKLSALRISDEVVGEGETAEFVVTLEPPSAGDVTVRYETVDDTALAGSDYRNVSDSLRFLPGETRHVIEVHATSDDTSEAAETFKVRLNDAEGATIEDDEGVGTIEADRLPVLKIGDAAAVREGEEAQFEVTLAPMSDREVTVRYSTHDDSALAGSDFESASDTLRFAPGITKHSITVRTTSDDTSEAAEQFTVRVHDAVGATIEDDEGVGAIEADRLPVLKIGDAAAVREGEEAQFEVTLAPMSDREVTVRYSTHDDSALAGSDFESTSGELRFDAGQRQHVIEVQTTRDDTSEAVEQFKVRLNDAVGATIEDDEGVGAIEADRLPVLKIGDAAAVREGEEAEFRVTLAPMSDREVTVRYSTHDDSALAGSDFESTSGELRFDAGQRQHVIEVQTTRDDTSEAVEQFTVRLHDAVGATIEDDEGVGAIEADRLPVLKIGDAAAVREGEEAEFRVTLAPMSDREVTVRYSTHDDSALAGSDFESTSGELRFDAGQRQHVIEVQTTRDAAVEPSEMFKMRLHDAVGATIEDGEGVGTISDDLAQRVDLVNRTLLPEAGRALAFNSVRCRIDRMFSNLSPVREFPRDHPSTSLGPSAAGWSAAELDGQVPEFALRNWSFLVPSKEGEDGGARSSMWGCSDYLNLDGGGEGGTVAWDGEVANVEFGADVALGPGALAGVSVSRSRASFDYFSEGGNGDAGGELGLALIGIHPYFGWSVSPDFDVWGTAGRSWGDFDIADAIAGERMPSEATLDLGAIGVVGRLSSWPGTKFALKGEFMFGRLDVAGNELELGAEKVNMQRLRMSTEATYEHVLSSGGSLASLSELGLRIDGGDGETGAGLEFGSGLRYRNPDSGWTVEGHSRWLALHEESAPGEWGVGGIVRLDPGGSGRGPSVNLTRSWGGTAHGAARRWEFGTTETFPLDASTDRIDLEMAYGFSAIGGRGVLTPFGAVNLDNAHGRVYRLGGRFASGRSALVSLALERRERPAREAVHALSLYVNLRF